MRTAACWCQRRPRHPCSNSESIPSNAHEGAHEQRVATGAEKMERTDGGNRSSQRKTRFIFYPQTYTLRACGRIGAEWLL